MSWFARILRERSRPTCSLRNPIGRLRLEEMESRLAPSSTSTNWSGYAVNSTAGSVTAVSGEFVVPTVSGSGASTYSSTWVGIDGYNSNSVEQTGIEADVINGVAHYSAWYEMFPASEVTIRNLAIHPGDSILASVTYSNGNFTLSIKDLNDPTGSNSFSITISDPSAQRSSAEWIEEAPSSRGVLPLAKFTPITFTNSSTTINGTTGSINKAAWASKDVAINMVSQSGTLEASTGALNAAGTSFTVTNAASSTSPPAPTPTPPPTPPPTTPPPSTTEVSTTTTLSAQTAGYHHFWPEAVVTVVVSPSVPVGSLVELSSDGSLLGFGRVEDINGVDEAQFDVIFYGTGTFDFTATFLGFGNYAPSTSNTVTVTVY